MILSSLDHTQLFKICQHQTLLDFTQDDNDSLSLKSSIKLECLPLMILSSLNPTQLFKICQHQTLLDFTQDDNDSLSL